MPVSEQQSPEEISAALAAELGQTPPPSADLELLVKTATEKLHDTAVDLAQVLRALSPPAEKPALPSEPPLPAVITEEQEEALRRLPEVFGKVVPHQVRKLTQPELAALAEERDVLDEIARMATKRKDDGIRVAVANHFDTEYQEKHADDEEIERDKRGHIVAADEVRIPDLGKKFVRQVSESAPGLSGAALKALETTGELSHDDYLAMTRPERIVDENKIMLLLRKKPELLRALQKATTPASKTASIYLRKA